MSTVIVSTDTSIDDKILHMERQYRVRYEPAPWGLFPVTHKIDGDPHATWGHISISNLEHVQWCLYDASGNRVIHGAEQNHARTRQGYWRAVRAALRHMRGGRRVYPRDPSVRTWPAGRNPWIRNMLRDADKARALRAGKCAMTTVESITDEQIRVLRDEAESLAATAQIALGFYASGGPVSDPERVRRARARCAEILSAREKEVKLT